MPLLLFLVQIESEEMSSKSRGGRPKMRDEKRISFKLNKSIFELWQQLKSDIEFGTHNDFVLHLTGMVLLSFFLSEICF